MLHLKKIVEQSKCNVKKYLCFNPLKTKIILNFI